MVLDLATLVADKPLLASLTREYELLKANDASANFEQWIIRRLKLAATVAQRRQSGGGSASATPHQQPLRQGGINPSHGPPVWAAAAQLAGSLQGCVAVPVMHAAAERGRLLASGAALAAQELSLLNSDGRSAGADAGSAAQLAVLKQQVAEQNKLLQRILATRQLEQQASGRTAACVVNHHHHQQQQLPLSNQPRRSAMSQPPTATHATAQAAQGLPVPATGELLNSSTAQELPDAVKGSWLMSLRTQAGVTSSSRAAGDSSAHVPAPEFLRIAGHLDSGIDARGIDARRARTRDTRRPVAPAPITVNQDQRAQVKAVLRQLLLSEGDRHGRGSSSEPAQQSRRQRGLPQLLQRLLLQDGDDESGADASPHAAHTDSKVKAAALLRRPVPLAAGGGPEMVPADTLPEACAAAATTAATRRGAAGAGARRRDQHTLHGLVRGDAREALIARRTEAQLRKLQEEGGSLDLQLLQRGGPDSQQQGKAVTADDERRRQRQRPEWQSQPFVPPPAHAMRRRKGTAAEAWDEAAAAQQQRSARSAPIPASGRGRSSQKGLLQAPRRPKTTNSQRSRQEAAAAFAARPSAAALQRRNTRGARSTAAAGVQQAVDGHRAADTQPYSNQGRLARLEEVAGRMMGVLGHMQQQLSHAAAPQGAGPAPNLLPTQLRGDALLQLQDAGAAAAVLSSLERIEEQEQQIRMRWFGGSSTCAGGAHLGEAGVSGGCAAAAEPMQEDAAATPMTLPQQQQQQHHNMQQQLPLQLQPQPCVRDEPSLDHSALRRIRAGRRRFLAHQALVDGQLELLDDAGFAHRDDRVAVGAAEARCAAAALQPTAVVEAVAELLLTDLLDWTSTELDGFCESLCEQMWEDELADA